MRKIKFAKDEYYHLYNRGVDKRIIFLDERDYERFVTLLFLSNSTKNFEISKNHDDSWSFLDSLEKDRGEGLVSIGAWCLMPNHFHILIKENKEAGISMFMQKLSVGYTKYFNKKYYRTGSLFEGTFKATHVDSDNYLKYLYAYIHLNPIGIIDKGWKNKKIRDIKKAEELIKSYSYSSLLDYVAIDRPEGIMLNKEVFPKYFENSSEFNAMINEWINFDKGIGEV